MSRQELMLLGCGILGKEILYLIRKNDWPIKTDFLDSALHVDFEALEEALQNGLKRNQDYDIKVFYGCCHPYMDRILSDAHALRAKGQNCLEMLLGRELFMTELSDGAFFLLEDWALRWDAVVGKTFGGNPDVVREIFQLSSKSILCIKTPCSGDFEAAAQSISAKTGLPLRWMDTNLDALETVLRDLIADQP